MDAHRHGQRLADLADDALDLAGHRAAVRIAEHHAFGAGIDRGDERLQRIIGVGAEAVKKMLALEDDAFAVFAAIGHAVGDHPQIFVPAGADDRDDLRKAAFAVKRHIFVGQRDRFFQQLVLARGDALPTCGVEGDGLECAETHPLALKLQNSSSSFATAAGAPASAKPMPSASSISSIFSLSLTV